MNITDLRSAQARFEKRIDSILEEKKELYSLAKKISNHFSINKIRGISLDEYAIGSKLSNRNHKYHFCYTLERTLDKLGRITGSTSIKFGLYYGVVKGDSTKKYRFSKKYGGNYNEAFSNVKEEIYNLLQAGKSEDLKAIADNRLSPMFKGKILSVYYPDRYLNIFSGNHLNYYLKFFGIDTTELLQGNAIYKREALLRYKQGDDIMKCWSLDIFSHFLYTEYPGRPDFENNGALAEYNEPDFPNEYNCELVDLEQCSVGDTSKGKKIATKKKIDYESDARKKRQLGDRGEKIVIDMEYQRLCDTGLEHLAKKIKWVSRESDSYGYDILSYNEDESKRHIEVKATSGSIGTTNFFISSNEYDAAKGMGANYYVYIVYDILTSEPKVWMSNNIFSEENKDKLLLTPTNYRVTINTKRSK